MSRGYPSMTALLGLLAIAGSAAGVPVPVASLVRDRPRRDGGFVGRNRTQPADSAPPSLRKRSALTCWTPCRSKQDCRGRIACKVVPRITGRRRQVHTAGTAPHVGRAARTF